MASWSWIRRRSPPPPTTSEISSSQTPVAVLRPGSVNDISVMIRFCKRHRIKVAARGQGHTTFGQAQVDGGLVIDMSTLNQIHSIGPTTADVDAGAKWRALLEAAVPLGLTPPVLTGFTGLSIAGTLSVGGISKSNQQGAQVDTVRELEVVTGNGDVVRCSARRNRDLFEAALGGLGQCGIITRAIVDVVPAFPLVRNFALTYTDNATFFQDFRTLIDRAEFDDVVNLWFPNATGTGFIYQLNATKYFEPSSPPDDGHLLRDLNFLSMEVTEQPYLAYELAIDFFVDFLRSVGLFDEVLHPWFDVFLSDSAVEEYVGDVLPTLTPEDVGPTGFMLLFAIKRSQLTRPFLRMPRSRDWVYLFDILTAAPVPGPDPDFQRRMLERNRRLFEKARRVGGTRYPISAIPFSRIDWILHYGEQFPRFARLKHRFDPARILTPGPGIF